MQRFSNYWLRRGNHVFNLPTKNNANLSESTVIFYRLFPFLDLCLYPDPCSRNTVEELEVCIELFSGLKVVRVGDSIPVYNSQNGSDWSQSDQWTVISYLQSIHKKGIVYQTLICYK